MAILKHVDFNVPGLGELPAGAQTHAGYTTLVADDQPTAWFRLGEGSGLTFASEVGSAAGTALPNSGNVWTGGMLGAAGAVLFDPDTAATFTGTGGRIAIDQPLLPTGAGDPFTVTMLLRTSARTRLLTQGLNYATAGDLEFYLPLGTGRPSLAIHDGAGLTIVPTTTACDDGQWHHLAAVREADGRLRIYLDGQDTTAAVRYETQALSPQPTVLGARASGALSLSGELDEVVAFDAALTAPRLAAHAAAARGELTNP